MTSRSIKRFILFLFPAAGILFGILLWKDPFFWRDPYQTVATADGEPVSIYCYPENKSTQASAHYLAYGIEQSTGAKTAMVASAKQGEWCIRILSGLEPPEQTPKRSSLLFTAASAGEIRTEAYSVVLNEDGISIFIPDPDECFGVVKAVTDRWLQKDCGLKKASGLIINQAMIRKQLSNLPLEIAGEIKVLSQNLRNYDDGEGLTVVERAARFFQLVEEYQPDLIGTQECTFQWLHLLEDALSNQYEIFGCSRMGPDSTEEEWNVVLYRKDRFRFEDGETFWLSNSPFKAATKLNYEGAIRICTWVKLQDSETGKTFLFSNTHLQNPLGDPEYYEAVRERQAEILFWRLRTGPNRVTQYPGFLTGDFNGEPNEPYYSTITAYYEDASVSSIHNSSRIDYSFHDYGTIQELLDFCFHSPENITVLDYRILDDQYGGNYISDHYGVLISAVLN